MRYLLDKHNLAPGLCNFGGIKRFMTNWLDIFFVLDTVWAYSKYKGKLTRFYFSKSSVQMYTIQKTLQNFGVLIYSRKFEKDGGHSFLVHDKQAEWAEQLCFRADFPKVGVHFPKNEKYRGAGLPKRQWKKGGRKGNALNILSDILKWIS